MALSPEASKKSVKEARALLAMDAHSRTEVLYGGPSRSANSPPIWTDPCGLATACMLLSRTVLDKADHAWQVAEWPVGGAVREILEVSQLPIHEQERDMAERFGLDGRVEG